MNKLIYQKYKIIFLLLLSLFSTKLFSLDLYGENWEKLAVEGKQKTIYVNSIYTKILTIFKDYNENSEYCFKKEIKYLKKLKGHPNIIKLIDYDEELYSIILEYCDMDLIDFINNNPDATEEEILDIFIDIAKGIKYMHDKNLIHQDIKPENVVLTIEENRFVAKLIDFSFCEKIRKNKEFVIVKSLGGTVGYLCPFSYLQCVNGIKKVYKSADIYSFGALMYSILTKSNIDTKKAILQKNSYKPFFKKEIKLPYLKKLILKCLKFNRIKRPTIDQILEKLLEIKSELTSEIKDSDTEISDDSFMFWGDLEDDDNWELWVP